MPPIKPKSKTSQNDDHKRSTGSGSGSVVSMKRKKFKSNGFLWDSLLEYQKETNPNVSTCDVHLVVANGDIVPVHAFVLQTVSPFFDEIFSTQKEAFYFGPRQVLLPDFSVPEVLKLIEFIYTGIANFVNEKESESFKVLMKAFGISDKKTELQKIPQPKKPEGSKSTKKAKETSGPTPMTKSLKTENKTNLYIVKKRNIKVDIPSSRLLDQNHKPAPKRPCENTSSDEAPAELDSDIDVAEENLDDKVKDTAWYYKELRRCQQCGKDYANAVDASTCITSHNRYRCYFCFAVERSTESLYAHYEKKHRKAPAREGYIICAFCEQPTANRSVSSHVISVHLNDPQFKNGTRRPSNSTSSTGSTAPGPSRPPANNQPASRPVPAPKPASKLAFQKKPATASPSCSTQSETQSSTEKNESDDDDDNGPLMVPDLHVVLQKRGILGNMRNYICKDDRSAER